MEQQQQHTSEEERVDLISGEGDGATSTASLDVDSPVHLVQEGFDQDVVGQDTQQDSELDELMEEDDEVSEFINNDQDDQPMHGQEDNIVSSHGAIINDPSSLQVVGTAISIQKEQSIISPLPLASSSLRQSPRRVYPPLMSSHSPTSKPASLAPPVRKGLESPSSKSSGKGLVTKSPSPSRSSPPRSRGMSVEAAEKSLSPTQTSPSRLPVSTAEILESFDTQKDKSSPFRLLSGPASLTTFPHSIRSTPLFSVDPAQPASPSSNIIQHVATTPSSPATSTHVGEDLSHLLVPSPSRKVAPDPRDAQYYKTQLVIQAQEHERKYFSLKNETELLKTQLVEFKTLGEQSQNEMAKTSKLWAAERDAYVEKIELLTREGAAFHQRDARVLELEGEKRDLMGRLLKREAEVSRLSEEVDQMTKSMSSSRQELWKANESLSNLHATTIAAESGHSALLAKIDQLTKSNEWLSQELEEKAKAFTSYRQEKSTQVINLQTDLSAMSMEKNRLESQRSALESKLHANESRIQELEDKIKEAEYSALLERQQFKNEMLSQKKLCTLYQGQGEELTAHNTRLEALVRDLEENLKAASVEMHNLNQAMVDQRVDSDQRLKEKNAEIANLSQQLELINTQIEQHGANNTLGFLSPSAAATSKILRSGKSYTEMFSEYAALQSSLMHEKRENARLNTALNELYADLEERAPAIQQLQETHEANVKEIASLSQKVGKLREQELVYEQSLKDANLRIDQLETENRLAVQEVKDLGKQVQHLTFTVEDKKAKANGAWSAEPDQPTDADAVITQRLVLFRDVQELQVQNTTLRRSLRSLSLKMETLEAEHAHAAESQRTKELDEAHSMIEALNEQLKLVNIKLDTFTRERDQWKRIAETRNVTHASSRSASPTPTDALTASAVAAGSEFERLYREVMRDFDVFKKETAADMNILKQSLVEAQDEKSQFALQVAKLENQVEYQNERYQLFVQNVESIKKERDGLRLRMTDMASTSTFQEAKVQELSLVLAESRKETERLRESLQALRVECSVLKSSESRYAKEAADLLKERNAANERLSKVQFSLSERELLAASSEAKFTAKLEEAEKEAELAKHRITQLSSELQALTARKEMEGKDYQTKVERFMVQVEKLKGELDLTRSKEEHSQLRVQEITSQLASAQEKLTVYEHPNRAPATSPEQVARDLEVQLAASRSEIISLRDELELEKKNVATYKDIARASEQRLEELNASYDVYKAEMDKSLADAQTHETELSAQIQSLQERLSQAVANVSEVHEKLDEQRNQYAQQIKTYQQESERLQKAEQYALALQIQAQKDMANQAELAASARTNYEREVVAHSESLQAVQELKKERSILSENLDKERAALAAHKVKWNTAEQSWNATKSELERIIEASRARAQDLSEQNNLLHSQFEALSASYQSTAIASAARDDAEPPTVAAGDASAIEYKAQELRQVIRFLRREKDILQTKFDLGAAELERSKSQIEYLQKSLDETRAILDEERASAQSSDTSGNMRHQELMERIEQANLLRESNVTLRNQLEDSRVKLSALEKEMAAMQEQLHPLQEKVSMITVELQVSKEENTALLEDNSRWKARTQQILERYERIDPVEHERLKTQVANFSDEKTLLTTNLREALASQSALTEEISKLNTRQAEYEQKVSALQSQLMSQETEASLKKKIEDLKKECEEISNDKKSLIQRSNTIVLKAKTAAAEKDEELKRLKEELVALKSESDQKLESRIAIDRSNLRAELEKLWQEKLSVAERGAAHLQQLNLSLQLQMEELTEAKNAAVAAASRLALSAASSSAAPLTAPPLAIASDLPPKREHALTNEDKAGNTSAPIDQPLAKRVRMISTPEPVVSVSPLPLVTDITADSETPTSEYNIVDAAGSVEADIEDQGYYEEEVAEFTESGTYEEDVENSIEDDAVEITATHSVSEEIVEEPGAEEGEVEEDADMEDAEDASSLELASQAQELLDQVSSEIVQAAEESDAPSAEPSEQIVSEESIAPISSLTSESEVKPDVEPHPQDSVSSSKSISPIVFEQPSVAAPIVVTPTISAPHPPVEPISEPKPETPIKSGLAQVISLPKGITPILPPVSALTASPIPSATKPKLIPIQFKPAPTADPKPVTTTPTSAPSAADTKTRNSIMAEKTALLRRKLNAQAQISKHSQGVSAAKPAPAAVDGAKKKLIRSVPVAVPKADGDAPIPSATTLAITPVPVAASMLGRGAATSGTTRGRGRGGVVRGGVARGRGGA